jgi:hypothetical protein
MAQEAAAKAEKARRANGHLSLRVDFIPFTQPRVDDDDDEEDDPGEQPVRCGWWFSAATTRHTSTPDPGELLVCCNWQLAGTAAATDTAVILDPGVQPVRMRNGILQNTAAVIDKDFLPLS